MAKVAIQNMDQRIGPAQSLGLRPPIVVVIGALLVMADLSQRRLTHVDEGRALTVRC